jgi:flagellar biosynthetic protein FliR
MQPIEFPLAEVLRFAIVFLRVAGIMVFAPLFSSYSIPFQVRAFFALVCSLAVLPALPLDQVPLGLTLGSIPGLAAGELIFGLVLGLATFFIFAALQLAGQIISFQLGFSIINVIDPQTQVETSVISFLENFIGLGFFLLINGHHWLFLAISESFRYFPATGLRLDGPLVQEFIHLSSEVLVSGVQIAAPVIAVTIITDMVLGIIGRVAPQIHILVVGMPLKTLVGFSCMSFSFYFLPQFLGDRYMRLFRELLALVDKMV